MSKKFLIASVLLFLGWGAQAKDDIASTTYTGNGSTKTVVMTGLRDGQFTFISNDNRYVSGNVWNESGFVHDFVKDTTMLFNDVIYAYFTPTHYVAALPGENSVPFIRKDGKDISLQKTIDNPTHANDISYWNAQPNGDKLVMLAYEWDYGTTGGVRDSATNPVGTIYNGSTGKVEALLHSYWPRLEPFRHEDNIAYGTRANAISADGTVVGGWGTWPTSFVMSTWQTTFWDIQDLDNVQTYAIEDYRFSMSDLVGANTDGSTLVGYNEETGHGLIIHYKRAQKSFTIDTIEPLPGFNLLFFNAVDDNGLVFGYCGMVADPSTRKAVVYSEETGLIDLKTFLYEYYNMTVPVDLGCPLKVAMDGSILAGFYYDHGYSMPWYIQFNADRILPRARNVIAKAFGDGFDARITWQEPLVSEHTLTGYEIYRDDNPVAIATPDKNTLMYIDEDCGEGRHVYKVVAVYGSQKADPASSNTIITGDIFPVQQIGNRLQYNRYAAIYWGLPSSEVVTDAVARATKGEKGQPDLAPRSIMTLKQRPVPASNPKYHNPTLDYIGNVDMQMYTGYAGIKIGDSSYVSSWSGSSIRILDQYDNVTEWAPKGLNNSILSMVYFEDQQKLYCGSLENIYILDLNNREAIEDVFECESRHLCYIDDLEISGTKGVLMAGGWNSCAFYTLEGQDLGEAGFDFSDLAVTGTAYYDHKLYVASQTGKYQNEIYIFDVASRQQIGEPIQVVEDPAVYDLLTLNGEVTSMDDLCVAGGLSICTLEDGTVALNAGYQCSYITSRLMLLELESAPDRLGYTLYRNGAVLAEGLKSRRFYDELGEAGTYKYEVVAKSTKGDADFSPATTLTIEEYGSCLPVKALTARETNRWVVLDWDVPTSDTSAGIIGFTVFRDGAKLKELWNVDVAVTYNDLSDLKIGTPYTYRIETLYKNGCTASDSVKITLTDEGKAMAPFGVRANYKKSATYTKDKKTYDVTVNWETPMFEEPLAIGYGTGQQIVIAGWGDQDPLTYWAVIGWDASDLALYEDLCLVGMEYLLGDNVKSFEAVVYLNSQQVLKDKPNRTYALAWQTMFFSKSFSMKQEKEVALGYHVTYIPDATPVTIDLSDSKRFYSDIISFDGKTWTCLADGGITGSWPLRALVARKRDVDAATSNGVLNPELLEGKLIRLDQPMGRKLELNPTSNQTMAMPSPKAPLTLRGFDVYRQRVDIDGQDKVQLNDNLLTTFSCAEAAPLPEGDYEYTVVAVYANATEPATISVTLDDNLNTEEELNGMSLTLYPNPASEILYVNGEYSQMEMLDLNGRVLRRLPAAPQIDLNGLTSGTYFFRFTDEAGRKATYKVVVK